MIDALVAGGGPAGLAMALYGAKAGLEVVVIEKRSGTMDKAGERLGDGMPAHASDSKDACGGADLVRLS